MNKKEVKKQVLDRVIPTKEYREKLDIIVKEIEEKLKNEIAKRKLPITVELVGSTAKDTYIKDNMDIDFFLLFPTDYSKEKIAENAISIGETFLSNTEESYAEHPYLRGYYKDFYVEIVPCYNIKDVTQKLSAVDRTPLHTKYVKENLKEKQKQEVLLFKQFLKGIGCYGAETQVEGFSGYLCEILIMHYGSFEKTIKQAKNWKPGEKLALSKGKFPSFDTPLTFIDPVDSERNVSSALSKEKFDLFIKACEEFKENPRITFFFPNKVKLWSLDKINNTIKQQNCKYIGVEINKPDIIDENLYPQIRKGARSIYETGKRYGFEIHDVVFHIDELKNNILLVVKTNVEPISDTFTHKGPPTTIKKNSEEFLNKWKDSPRVTKEPYEKNDRLYVELKREYIEIKDFLKDEVKELSMGKHLDKIVNKKYRIIELEDMLKENLKTFWTEYLDGKMSWER